MIDFVQGNKFIDTFLQVYQYQFTIFSLFCKQFED